MRFNRLCIVLLGVGLGACISNRQVAYLQKDDLNKGEQPKDSVVRTYNIPIYEYKIQPLDLISVQVESQTPEEYNPFSAQSANSNINLANGNAILVGNLVDENGDIELPELGKIHVAGLTVFEIQSKIQGLLEVGKLLSPIVKIRLLNFAITVLGEVNSQGSFQFNGIRGTVLDAIGKAGGLTELADRSNVKLIRQINGTVEVQYLDLLDEDIVNSPYYYVHNNDVIIVAPLKQRPFRRYFGQNVSILLSSVSLFLLILNLSK